MVNTVTAMCLFLIMINGAPNYLFLHFKGGLKVIFYDSHLLVDVFVLLLPTAAVDDTFDVRLLLTHA